MAFFVFIKYTILSRQIVPVCQARVIILVNVDPVFIFAGYQNPLMMAKYTILTAAAILSMPFAGALRTKTNKKEVLSAPSARPGERLKVNVIKYGNKWYKAGDTIYGYKNYVFLVVGDKDAPLMLGVPHDGVLAGNPVIPEVGTTGRDINTNPFATAIARLFREETGLRPWIMVNLIGRKRIDPNTYPPDVEKNYQNEDARKTWYSYHELISAGRKVMAASLKNRPGGLFIDVHGHAHQYANGYKAAYISPASGNQEMSSFIDQTDIGYAISNYALEQDDSYLDELADSSSIYAISKAHPSIPFSELIRGEYSFGGLLQAQSVNAVPGNITRKLRRDAREFGYTRNNEPARSPYFNGGYLTRRYGTVKKGSTSGYDDNISSLQIETPGITVRNSADIIAVAAPRFNRAIINYLVKWYNYKP